MRRQYLSKKCKIVIIVLILLIAYILIISRMSKFAFDSSVKESNLPSNNNDIDAFVNSNEIPENMIFDSISELKKCDLNVGDICITKGYYKENDLGSAQYVIVSGYFEDNGITYHKLDNGLYANLLINNETFNVMEAGIQVNTRVSEKLNEILELLEGKASIIQFNDGRYLIDSVIYLKSFNYYGTGTTEFYVEHDFDRKNDDKIFTTNVSYEAGILTSLSFKGINFLFETSQGHTMQEYETIFIQLTGIEYCLIEDCSIISRQAEKYGIPMAIDNLWFRNGDAKNITIKNLVSRNLTSTENDNVHRIGGCIWFWGNNKYTISNVSVSDSIFETTATDENLSIWECYGENIEFKNCDFINGMHDSDNLISVNGTRCSNLVFRGCNFYVNTPTLRVFKASNDFADLQIVECNFYLNSGNNDIWGKQFAVFDFSGINHNENVLESSMYEIQQCKILSTKETFYNSCVTGDNVNINIYKNDIEANLSSGLLWIENTCINAKIEENKIDTMASKNFITIKNLESAVSSIDVKNNTIVQSIHGVMAGDIAIQYMVENNVLLNKQWGALYYDMNTSLDEELSKITFNNNTVYNRSNFDLVYSDENKEIEASKIFEMNNNMYK